MIRNYTYYLGKPFIKIERFPYYEGKTKLNMIHIDFKFFKVVSRVKAEKYNLELLLKIAKQQNVELKTYDINDHGETTYYNYTSGKTLCYVKKDIWLSIGEVFMCYKNNMIIEDHGLAQVYDDNKLLIGYFGYSHRGGQTFKIGDKIFDPEWKMNEFHKDFKKYKKKLNKSKYSTRIEEVIPYKERGEKRIKTIEEAKKAAIKISKELD